LLWLALLGSSLMRFAIHDGKHLFPADRYPLPPHIRRLKRILDKLKQVAEPPAEPGQGADVWLQCGGTPRGLLTRADIERAVRSDARLCGYRTVANACGCSSGSLCGPHSGRSFDALLNSETSETMLIFWQRQPGSRIASWLSRSN
jgi:hypothetical protein